MCQLRGHVDPAVETRWKRALPVQRLRALPQDERPEQAHPETVQATVWVQHCYHGKLGGVM